MKKRVGEDFVTSPQIVKCLANVLQFSFNVQTNTFKK